MGKSVEVWSTPGADHAFFNAPPWCSQARGCRDAWRRTLELFRQNVR